MRNFIVILLLISYFFSLNAQVTNVEEKFALPESLNESSGIILVNNRIIIHNDSGNENKLYEIDTLNGAIVRTIIVQNATNVDWEDIAQDENFIYVGDIGNNNGNRTDLKIYKVNKNSFLNSNEVQAEIIEFNYEDQQDFTITPNENEWDAEALISFDEEDLIVFTKNWVDGETKAYKIPKEAGNYSVEPCETTLNAQGLITGATYNYASETLLLTGYTIYLDPFVWIVKDFDDDIFSGNNERILLPELEAEKIEAIAFVNSKRYFIASESFQIFDTSDNAKIISIDTTGNTAIKDILRQFEIEIYPNPVSNQLFIKCPEFKHVEIYDSKQSLVTKSNTQKISTSHLPKGIYFVKITLTDNTTYTEKVIKK